LSLWTPGYARRGLRRAAGAPHGLLSPGRYSHSDTTLYIISLVILHIKYTGARQSDPNLYA
jgi:hypothetical protein